MTRPVPTRTRGTHLRTVVTNLPKSCVLRTRTPLLVLRTPLLHLPSLRATHCLVRVSARPWTYLLGIPLPKAPCILRQQLNIPPHFIPRSSTFAPLTLSLRTPRRQLPLRWSTECRLLSLVPQLLVTILFPPISRGGLGRTLSVTCLPRALYMPSRLFICPRVLPPVRR